MIAAHQAMEEAARQIAGGPGADDPEFAAWRGAAASEPLLVRDLAGRPSYWLVPVVAGGRTVGAVRVLGDGRVAAVEALRAGSAVSALGAAEAERRAERAVESAAGESAAAPELVHDGPPGREAWRVEVTRSGRPSRWIFVTPGGVYERPAGTSHHGEGLE
ncbi:MAG TPA: hypothetical protein VF121_15655 [Thermoanaerobaculia bacterium]|nr:hypothetical protein [Thermoanaerobaculia bacterium]